MKKRTIIGLSLGAGVVALAAAAAGYIWYVMKSLDGLQFNDITIDEYPVNK